MFPFRSEPIIRLRVGPPGGEEPRSHPRQAHPPSVVKAVRHLVETTRLPFRVIAERTRVNSGTVSRWAEKHGWQRPPGAHPFARRPEKRYVPVVLGRALSQRLRVQAERLLSEIEAAPQVDPAALAEAGRLLAEAREAQFVRRGRRYAPPSPAPTGEGGSSEGGSGEARQKTRKPHDRSAAARKGWSKRWSRARYDAWMKEPR